jgi:hypothetical protein
MSDEIIKIPRSQQWVDFLEQRLPIVVWSISALVCVWLLTDRSGRFEYIGLARALHHEISPETTGKIDTLFVELYEDVAAGEVVAYLRDEQVGRPIVEHTPVLLASRRNPGRAAESLVVRVSPDVEMLPERLWRTPGHPDYGRAVVIAAVPELGLAPGELVDVRVLD